MIDQVFRLAVILIVLIALGGCARSQTTNYYILHSLQTQGSQGGDAGTDQGPAVGVGPVKVPDYLDRPQIVTRTTRDNIQIAEFDRWAEPLEKNLTRVLADNLSTLVPSEHVCVFPWRKCMPVQYQVTMEIIHLEKEPDDKIMLDASWSVLENDGEKLIATKRSKLVVPVESAGFEAIASAESRAVEELSGEIASVIKSLPR